jgi:biotin carboxyl carrier protein
MYKAIINNSTEIAMELADGETLVNGEALNWDIVRISDRQFHIIKGNKSYEVELIKKDDAVKSYDLKVNGKILKVDLKDKADLLLKQLGLSNLTANARKDIKAPMPGLILNILVEEGKDVKKGDPLLILEAMKMENVIKSPADGTIKAIKTQKGKSVEKNQILIEF